VARARQNWLQEPATLGHGLEPDPEKQVPIFRLGHASKDPSGARRALALGQLGHARTSHRIDVFGTGEGARPDFLRISLHRLLDGGSQIAEALDEFRYPRGKPEHILKHEDLAVAGRAGADADRGNCDLRRDAASQRLGDRFQHHRKRTSIRHGTRIGLDARPLALIAALGPARAADPCADKAIAVQALHQGDEYQAAALLFAFARLGCAPEARALLDRGAAVDAKDREGATALGRAAQAGKIAVAALLLDRGAGVNARSVDGSTPLFYAAEADRAAMIRLLIGRGADPNIAGRKGIRPLAAAAYEGSAGSVKLM